MQHFMMDKVLGIFLFTFIFSVFEVYSEKKIVCPRFNEKEAWLMNRAGFKKCLVEVRTDKVKTEFEPIQSFERYCLNTFFSHLEWPRDIYYDAYHPQRQKNTSYYAGYKALDVSINAGTITAISGGIVRVDYLHMNSLVRNESSVVFPDMVASTMYDQGIPEYLCLVGFTEQSSSDDSTYDILVIWERCTIRETDVFYCDVPPMNDDFIISDQSIRCKEGKTGDYCHIEKNSCQDVEDKEEGCQKNGLCFVGSDKTYCKCFPGKKGKFCEETVDACSNVNCNNRGTCEVKDFIPVCNCTDEMYEGAFCERRVSNKPLFEEVNIMDFQSIVDSFD
ncbi:Sushi, nidogen and EGF-like domain-containing protein 1 [Trichinella zimbabwensis]|uniref:Sushi, nidogen and EGF-like domain-containing protein 1 n=1 Tax=Trichinella zimbabwensis TaxID=268475 RepID=A0A0V1H0K7_9BILA|nr:Sushi, nidogen and EGF-like domain-containing protein 1 [Trichinella zimbabwensis]